MSIFDSEMIAELESLPKGKHHEDSQDASALNPPPTTGILVVDFARFEQRVDRNRRFINPEEAKKAYNDALQKIQDTGHPVFNPDSPFVSIEARSHVNTMPEKPHVEIPRETDIFKPTKSTLNIFSEQNKRELEKYLAKFGEQNGYPVIFVTTSRTFDPPKEDIVHEALITTEVNIQMFKKSEMREAANFAIRNAGELGIFDPRSKDEQIKDLEKKVKRLEEERDYWKREAIGKNDDTLGTFSHWDD